MADSKKVHYELGYFYPGFDRQKFWDVFFDIEAWSKSDILPAASQHSHKYGLLWAKSGSANWSIGGKIKKRRKVVWRAAFATSHLTLRLSCLYKLKILNIKKNEDA